MNSIIFLLLVCLLVLVYLLLKQKKKITYLNEVLQELEETQEIKEIKANLIGRDQERVRIANDWHDGIGNSLSILRLLLDTIQPKNPKRHTEVLELLEDAQKELKQIIDKELVCDFSNEQEVNVILSKWQRQLQIGNIKLKYKVYEFYNYINYTRLQKTHLYRILQELMNNAIKHSGASLIEIELTEKKETILLSVKDNGKGLLENKINKYLLRSVKDRVKIINGKIGIQTENELGTIIEISIPAKSI